MIRCTKLAPARFEEHATDMFDILADNMNAIAPTGCSREEDFALWHASMREQLSDGGRQIVLAIEGSTLAGYVQFSLQGDVLMMDEIEIRKEMQGRGAFRALFDAMLTELPPSVVYAEAYANKANAKSIAILGRLGLTVIGENRSGRSWHFRGTTAALRLWQSGNSGG